MSLFKKSYNIDLSNNKLQYFREVQYKAKPENIFLKINEMLI